ncbi:MAG: isoprenyl transferase [Candidatus Omnitrophica bacterium]|nr:isoprenyl transferase [Candidatus Omnitrophota bacterium]
MLDTHNIPQHIAFIMDGNGRWAKARGLSRTAGHRQGIERVREIVRASGELGIKVATFFAFSTENWSRPKAEVTVLMRYLQLFLEREVKELDKNNVRLRIIGQGPPIPSYLQKKLKEAERKTQDNTGLVMVLAINYGSRQEIVEAAKRFARRVQQGTAHLEDLTVETFSDYLFTEGLPDPDLLVRTSGEMRISNFLLWQLSYAELYFVPKYWPDFKRPDLEETIAQYQRRERRFGRVHVS